MSKFSTKTKLEIVLETYETGKFRKVAADHKISPQLLQQWRKKLLGAHSLIFCYGTPKTDTQRLRRRIRRLRIENETLRRSLPESAEDI